MPGFPPYQKGMELSGGGEYFFKTPEALRLYKSGYPPAKLKEEGKLFILEAGSKVVTLEPSPDGRDKFMTPSLEMDT
jgi:hypothetical protein